MRIKSIILASIIFLGLLSITLAYFSAKSTSNDKRKLSDLNAIASALSAYYDENGFYPNGSNNRPAGLDNYLEFWPDAKDKCGYSYVQKSAGDDYQINFCITHNVNGISAGQHFLSSKGIQ